MSEEEFKRQYAMASALVESWPIWKQNILQISESRKVSVPRDQVDNTRNYRECLPIELVVANVEQRG